MSTEIVFETHSWSEDNDLGNATGWLPGTLSERGQELARELGARRRDDGISRCSARTCAGRCRPLRSHLPIWLCLFLPIGGFGNVTTGLAELSAADFDWREGWEYLLTDPPL
jgi:broad specificity phosphatase PhoE